ncbi:hypothetical protein BJX65DRAFT_229277 [Aspergillus insuetus]
MHAYASPPERTAACFRSSGGAVHACTLITPIASPTQPRGRGNRASNVAYLSLGGMARRNIELGTCSLESETLRASEASHSQRDGSACCKLVRWSPGTLPIWVSTLRLCKHCSSDHDYHCVGVGLEACKLRDQNKPLPICASVIFFFRRLLRVSWNLAVAIDWLHTDTLGTSVIAELETAAEKQPGSVSTSQCSRWATASGELIIISDRVISYDFQKMRVYDDTYVSLFL